MNKIEEEGNVRNKKGSLVNGTNEREAYTKTMDCSACSNKLNWAKIDLDIVII